MDADSGDANESPINIHVRSQLLNLKANAIRELPSTFKQMKPKCNIKRF